MKVARLSRPWLVLVGILALVAVFALQPVPPVYAATYVVTKTADTNDGVCDADCSLREAITAANATLDNDVITFAASANGTITLASALPNLTNNGTLTIDGNGAADTIISGNAVRVFVVDSGATVTIQDLTVTNGRAAEGGGILNNGTLTVTNSTISGNTAFNVGGGIRNDGTLTVTNSSFSGNIASNGGGGIYNGGGGTLTVANSTISGNSSFDDGGGINNDGTLTVTNSTFSGNSSGGSGGGINNNAGTVTVTNSTFSGNTATFGGGIRNTGVLNLNNSIVAGSANGGDCVLGSGTINASHSLIQGGLGCINGTNTNNLTGNPLLDANLVPQAGSPAVNSGDNALIPVGITTDLAGNARIQNGTVDRGAFETAFLSLPTVTITGPGTVAEGANGDFTITRTRDTTSDLTVTVNITPGTGTDASDYTLSGGAISGQTGNGLTVVIPTGQASVNVNFAALAETPNAAEAENTLTITLVDDTDYDLGAAGTDSATVTIPANGLVVTTTANSGEGSLRQAISNANADGVASTITFAPSANGTITLASALPDLANNGTLAIDGNGAANSIISGNNAVRVFNVASGATVTIQDVTVTNGSDTEGGGINNNAGTLTVTNSTFSGNTGNTNGGGIYNNLGTLTVSNSSFSGNTATFGGGIYNNAGTLTVSNSSFSGNSASGGGGINNFGTLTVTNSTFSGNSAASIGGGINNNAGTLTVTNSTFSGNTATFGGGILNNGILTLNNSIVAGSTSGSDCVNGGLGNASHSLIQDGLTCVNGTNTNNLTGNPLLDANLIPQAGSPAINSGDNALIPGGITTDLAGNARIQGGIVDMGAFETAFLPTPTVTITGPGTVAEGANGNFTLTRTGDTTGDLTVMVNITPGTDMNDSDYDLSGGSISGQTGNGLTVVIPTGQASVNVNFAALVEASNAAEAANTLTITLVDQATYNLGATGTETATATIPANGLVVTTTADSGEGSLRQAIANANADGVNSTITFEASANGTITLASALPNLANNGTLTITGNGAANTIVSGNNAVQVFSVVDDATVTIQNLTVTAGNFVVGGGIANSGTLTVTGVRFSANSASSSGGSIASGGILIVSNSIFSGNSAAQGGGIASSGILIVSNSIFSGNSAAQGGGILNIGALTLNNSTVSGNSAPSGGGILNSSGTLTLNNSIIAGSTSGGDCVIVGGTINAIHSIIQDGLTCVNGTNSNNLTGDPLLDANQIPQAGSPAINSGDNALIPVGITTDLAGNARIQGGTVDRGAFETAFLPPTVTISATDGAASEAGPDSGTFQITRTGATTAALTVSYTVGGTADTSDYTPTLTGTVDIPIGQASVDVTITPVDDAIDEDDETVVLTLVAGPGYELGAATSATVTIADNDTSAILVDTASLIGVPEDDTRLSTTFTLAAETEPTAAVDVTLTPDAQCDAGNGGGTAVTVTLPAGSTAAQTVTVQAVDDAVAEAAQHDCVITLSAASTDPNYDGVTLADVTVTVLDNDIPFTVTTSGDAAEGTGTDTVVTFTVTPGAAIANVGGSVSYTVNDTSGTTTVDDFSAALPSGTLNFGVGGAAQQVQITVIGDTADEPDFTLEFAITAMTSGTTSTPSSVGAPATVTITDDDSAGVTVTESGGTTDVTEGGAPDSFTVRLNTAPVSPVTITLTPDAGLSLSTTTLIFDAVNWLTEQTVEVTADDDAVVQGTRTASVALAVTTAGADYTGILIPSVSVNISDNDSAGIVISPNSFSVTEGLTRSYQIRLGTIPTVAPVTVWVEFDTAQLTVNGNSAPFALVFSDTTPQTVTFRVNGSDEINTTRDLVITHTVSSSAAPEYPVGTGANVSLQIVDYPPPPPTPLCEAHNFDERGVVRSSITDALGYAINCRILFQNGAPTSWLGTALYSEANLGVPGLLELGVQQAVDIFSPPGMTYFEGGAVFCLRGQGTLIWLAASGMPRHPEIIGSYTVPDFPGFTCATLFEPGTLILVSRNPISE